jgi:hypothetical protein
MLRYTPQRDGRAVVEIIPCLIDGYQPRLAKLKERAKILQHLTALSLSLGSAIPNEQGKIVIPARPKQKGKK